MNITKNDQYKKLEPLWAKCRLTIEGDDALKNSSEIGKIVPRLEGQKDSEYKAMVARATLFNASARTKEGLLGLVFRKDVDAVYPEAMHSVIDDMTLAIDNRMNLNDFCYNALAEDIEVGRVGHLIEMPKTSTEGMTKAQVAALNLRPYVAVYRAESIMDWRFDRVNNAAQLVMVRLYEEVDEWVSDVERKTIKQERRLLLEGGVYIQRVYRDTSDGKSVIQIGDDIIPQMNSKALSFIPFICDLVTGKPPILDLVNINLSHFRTEVDREHGAHYTATPTPMFAGFQFADGEAFHLGATSGYSTTNPDAKWGYLEFEGAGLATLKEIKEEKAQQMAVMGARFLDQDKAAAEAEGTVKLRRSGETSVLSALAKYRSMQVKRTLEIMRDWMGISGDITVEINSDYSEVGLSSEEMTALFAMLQGGSISEQTFFYNMKRGELYEDGTTFEEEQERIRSQGIQP